MAAHCAEEPGQGGSILLGNAAVHGQREPLELQNAAAGGGPAADAHAVARGRGAAA